jgi:hypothetical protein
VLKDLHENFNYHKAIEQFNYSQNLGVYLKNVIWDLNSGALLKLDTNKTVVKAVHGWDSVQESDLLMLYGESKQF